MNSDDWLRDHVYLLGHGILCGQLKVTGRKKYKNKDIEKNGKM